MFINEIVSTPDGDVHVNGYIGRGQTVVVEHVATLSRYHGSCLTLAEVLALAAQGASLATLAARSRAVAARSRAVAALAR